MAYGKVLALSVFATVLLCCSPLGPAQVAVDIGVAPVCPYGYYGPDWFVGGIFIGAGPWFHGPHGFYGHVDNRFDPHHGYNGPLPARGEAQFNHFHGNEARDGQGHVGNAGHDAGNEHALPGFRGGGHAAGHRR